ncbi:MAG: hypothetical protein KIH44_002835 [Octadecabacter sp.]|nr:hypothetical protein [Octadecabacter sp.]
MSAGVKNKGFPARSSILKWLTNRVLSTNPSRTTAIGTIATANSGKTKSMLGGLNQTIKAIIKTGDIRDRAPSSPGSGNASSPRIAKYVKNTTAHNTYATINELRLRSCDEKNSRQKHWQEDHITPNWGKEPKGANIEYAA